jgi:hypothetical protein|nr:hypothetical protein [uncultured Acetatifactor sp.]
MGAFSIVSFIEHSFFFDFILSGIAFTQILLGLLNNGFALEAVEKAKPPEEMMHIPQMKDELRRPMTLLVKAGKNSLNAGSSGLEPA